MDRPIELSPLRRCESHLAELQTLMQAGQREQLAAVLTRLEDAMGDVRLQMSSDAFELHCMELEEEELRDEVDQLQDIVNACAVEYCECNNEEEFQDDDYDFEEDEGEFLAMEDDSNLVIDDAIEYDAWRDRELQEGDWNTPLPEPQSDNEPPDFDE